MEVDRLKIYKTLAFLLRHRPDVGHLDPDSDGWCEIEAVTRAVVRLTRRRISSGELLRIATRDPRGSFQVRRGHIRACPRGSPRAFRGERVPDILYLSGNQDMAELALQRSVLELSDGAGLRLHVSEHQAWLEAHRQSRPLPRVFYVDASRARRAGLRFQRSKKGIYTVARLPIYFILNLREGFGIQASAGGFLVDRGSDGIPRVALIRVRRRSGITWEVAKGKMEIGESPADTAIRETREEMGLQVPVKVVADLGVSHYGFTTPSGNPRLKVLYLFVLVPTDHPGRFSPASREGIVDVAFFLPEDAVKVVTHASLHRPVRRLKKWLGSDQWKSCDKARST